MRRALALIAATVLLLCIFQSPAQGAELLDQGTLYGTVYHDDSTPMSNVTIEARNATGVLYHSLSNESGYYELDVPNGVYNITALYQNYTANTTYANVSISSDLGPYNFTMTEVLGTISGIVTDDGNPVLNVLITISNVMNATYTYTGTSQMSGFYKITGVEPGAYVAYAEKRGYDGGRYWYIEIVRDSTVMINFTLEKQAATLNGTISTENNGPLDEVKVTLDANDGTTPLYTFTDSNGNYTFPSLSAGTYTVTFEKDGYESETKSLEFDPFEDKRVDMTLAEIEIPTEAVLFGYDITHSLMIIGFMVGMIIVLAGVTICYRSNKRPEMLAQVEKKEEEKSKED